VATVARGGRKSQGLAVDWPKAADRRVRPKVGWEAALRQGYCRSSAGRTGIVQPIGDGLNERTTLGSDRLAYSSNL